MYYPFKRFIDVAISGVALLLLSPILLTVIIILLLTGEHEVFYFQKRVGYKNKPFYIWKFATMLKNSPNMGPGDITLRNDSRVTGFGKFLRITKINELPQIINIFKGDMSVVGPRPLLEKGFKLYPIEVQNKIYDRKPGITGIGSLVFRDEEKLLSEAADPHLFYALAQPYKGSLEMWYHDHASTTTDFAIIFLTACSILFPENKLVYKIFKDLPENNLRSYSVSSKQTA